jgi:sugar phosphate isomerase/epimerase
MAKVTRRAFTTGLAGASAGLWIRGARAREAKVPPSVFGGIEVGVQSYTFRAFSLERMIGAMSSIGISSLELWQGHLDPAKAREADFPAVRSKLDAAGIKVNAYCVNFPPEATDEYLERAFRGAKELGTHVMTASVRKGQVPRLDEWCSKHEVYLGLHNHWFGDPWFKGDRKQEFEGPDDFEEALAGRSRFLAVNLDVGHFSAAGHDPVPFIRTHHDRIVSLHVKDRDRDPARTNRRFGEGATPIREVARVLKEVRFRRAANLEYEIDESDPTEGVRHAFSYFRRALEEKVS